MSSTSFPYEASLHFAKEMDANDPLRDLKKQFLFPEKEGKPVIYFCGNSLGLQPVTVKAAIEVELNTWHQVAIGGYFGGANPWLRYHEYCIPALCEWMGGQQDEITVMNALTVNLHLMLQTFYQPTYNRFKIVMEAGAFPSDQYAVETLVRQFGFNPEEAIVEVAPKPGEHTLQTKDILKAIANEGDAVALVMFSGMNYYTGQLFDIQSITKAAHAVGAIAGFDLAHVAGNVPVQLHDWQVDFAVWCSYKYLNAGPGAVGGVFIHHKHASNTQLKRPGGWWGNEESTRFKMEKGFIPKPDANGWLISTSQVFNTVCLKASLEVLRQAGVHSLRQKSILLTGYLAFLLQKVTHLSFKIITPANPEERGAQLSLLFATQGKAIHDQMNAAGIVVDYREPGVIRVAPAPAYCSFEDVYRFYEILMQKF